MNTNSIAFNSLLKKSICSYRGPLNVDDLLYYDSKYELEGIEEDGLVEIEGVGKVKTEDIECEWEWKDLDTYRLECGNIFWENIDRECGCNNEGEDLQAILERYGVFFSGMDIDYPKYYNYRGDELSFHYSYDDKPIDESLNSYIENYIDNVRQKSCDGYTSFEPTSLEDVDKSDYAFIYAILDKEGLIDKCKEGIDKGIEQILGETVYNNARFTYRYNGKEYRANYNTNKLILNSND